jgi:hypothetical protein
VSLPTYEDALARARDEIAFSNGSMWETWSGRNCCRCANDGMGLGKDEPQCPLILVGLRGKTPMEWTDQQPPLGDYLCAYFRDRDDPGGREPEPVPDPPGQLALMPREPWEGVRMYADTRPRTAGAVSS